MNKLRFLWAYFQSERNYYRRERYVDGRPFVFSVETTSVCNLKCSMCPHKDMTRNYEMMDYEVFCRVIREVEDYNGLIWLHNLGEPLAHPRIMEMIRFVKDRGLRCGLSTNATLLDDERSDQLLSSGLDKIILCMDGITKESYERLRVGARFESVVTNIERFLRLRKERKLTKPQAVVQLIYMKQTEPQVREFHARWRPLADRVLLKRFSTWADQVESISQLSTEKHRYELAHIKPGVRYPCAYLWRNLVVTASGDVIPCCMDYDARMVMGNVMQNTLAEIWRGEKYLRLRRDHIEGRFTSTCESCKEWVGGPSCRAYPLGRPLLYKLWNLLKKV
ncbi:MAG: radical SAM protein [bacterium]|nr:radical SAM protein [bacterium]